MRKIIVIGSSTTGMTAASKIKRTLKDNVQIVGYQKLPYPSLGACGLPYFLSDQFSNSNMMIARTVEQFAEQGIEVRVNHEVLSVDSDHKMIRVKNLLTGEIFTDTYDDLIIATGGTAKKLAIPNVDAHQVFTLNNIADAVNIKQELTRSQDVVIIGAGFIGLEVAENLTTLKKRVTIIENSDRLASRVFDVEISNLITAELNAHGVQVMCNTTVAEILVDNNKNVVGVRLENGTILKCEMVIFAMGITPNTQFLANSKIRLHPNHSIEVNARCQTSVPNVYAGGDCVSTYFRLTNQPFYSAMATTASKMGKVIANNILGQNDTFGGSIGTAIVQIFAGQAVRCGLNEYEARALQLPVKTVLIQSDDHTHYVPGAKPLVIKVLYDTERDILLGAQLYGYNNAILRIDALIAMIWGQNKVRDYADLDLPYSPQFAKSVDALNLVLFKLANK